MSRGKTIAVITALAVFTLWPAVQIGLSFAYDVNPWKLASWGMYAAPQIPSWLRVHVLTPDEIGSYELRSLSAEHTALADAFLARHRGLLVLGEDLGRGPSRRRHRLVDHALSLGAAALAACTQREDRLRVGERLRSRLPVLVQRRRLVVSLPREPREHKPRAAA